MKRLWLGVAAAGLILASGLVDTASARVGFGGGLPWRRRDRPCRVRPSGSRCGDRPCRVRPSGSGPRLARRLGRLGLATGLGWRLGLADRGRDRGRGRDRRLGLRQFVPRLERLWLGERLLCTLSLHILVSRPPLRKRKGPLCRAAPALTRARNAINTAGPAVRPN